MVSYCHLMQLSVENLNNKIVVPRRLSYRRRGVFDGR